jgi:hypothetical protein
MSTAKEQLIEEAQGLMFDTDPGAQDVPQKVWDSVIPQALRDFSRYSPRLLPLTIAIEANALTVDLPAGFIEIDVTSFNRAINTRNLPYSYRSFVYVLNSTTSASSDLPSYFSTFNPQTSYRFADGGANGKQLIMDPVPAQASTLKCLYNASHILTEPSDDDEVGSISVPDDKRDLLLLKMCALACRALARQLAGDKYLQPHYTRLAADFNEDYENRTRFVPVGFAG